MKVKINYALAVPYFKKYGVQKAAVFGSVARDQAKKGSDIDFVVSFSRKYDLLELIGLKQDLEDAFNRPVDVITYNALKSDAFAKNVLSEAKVIYEQN